MWAKQQRSNGKVKFINDLDIKKGVRMLMLVAMMLVLVNWLV